MDHLLASVFLLLSPFIISATSSVGRVNRLATPDILSASSVIETETSFAKETVTAETSIPFATSYQEDSETEYGTERKLSPGQIGTKVETFEITFWEDAEIDRRLIGAEITPPQDEIVLQGTKIVWSDLPTPDQGVLRYWHKLNVRATSYDANCIGCTGRTFTGTEVHHGVCATDPRVIPLGTTFYVPGYGLCHAEDIGGAIKGNKIDLGWEDVRFGWWSTRWVDIYLIDNAPY